jgi:hypothetical protein
MGGGTLKQDGSGPQEPLNDAPRSPSGRVPQWVIDEAQGRSPQHAVPWRGALPSVEPGRSRGRGRRGWSTGFRSVIVVLAIIGIAAWLQTAGVLKPWAGNTVASRPANVPSPSREESGHPLGVPAPLAATGRSYVFMAHQADGTTPVTYDPCRPIHYVIRVQGEPVGGNQIIKDAVSRVSQATGLRFIYDGPTSEAPSAQRQSYQPKRYGDRWVPVLISWATASENRDFAAGTFVTGEGGSTRIRLPNGASVYVTGAVELDPARLSGIQRSPGGDKIVRAVVLHELGHLVGLAHVADATQIMYPQSQAAVTDFGAGDLTGLRALGKGQCQPDL